MSKSDSETSVTKSIPIIIQHEGSSFNLGIVLNETNYDLWSQMLEMQITEKEKPSFVAHCCHLRRKMKAMKSGIQTIRRSKDGY